MTITTKFSIGDTAYFINEDGIKKEVVKTVGAQVAEDGEEQIVYSLGAKRKNIVHQEVHEYYKNQDDLFASKEDLIKHIETL